MPTPRTFQYHKQLAGAMQMLAKIAIAVSTYPYTYCDLYVYFYGTALFEIINDPRVTLILETKSERI